MDSKNYEVWTLTTHNLKFKDFQSLISKKSETPTQLTPKTTVK
jgi:hypothetical protein